MSFALDRRHQIYLILTGIFVTSLLVADLVAGKYFQLGPLEMSVGTVTFPIAFLLTDIVNEYYGQRGARWMTAVGMGMLVLAFALIAFARALPPSAGTFIPEEAFQAVFGMAPRLIFSSLAAYLISQLVDIYTFHVVKRLTQSKHLWARAIGSTALSQIVDTVAVNFGVMLGARSLREIATITMWSYLYKLIVAIALTPLCYLAHDVLTIRLGIEPMPVGEDVQPSSDTL